LPQEVTIIPNDGELFLRVMFIQADRPGLQTAVIPIP
jgi:hypothetical protein